MGMKCKGPFLKLDGGIGWKCPECGDDGPTQRAESIHNIVDPFILPEWVVVSCEKCGVNWRHRGKNGMLTADFLDSKWERFDYPSRLEILRA